MTNQQLSDEEITRKLHAHPHIRERIISILSVVESDAAGLRRADDAEERLVQEIRRMGQEAMQAWALNQIEQTEQEVRHTGRAHREGKKTELAHHLRRHHSPGTPIPKC